MNILIIRLSSLGDIVHTFPMLSDIKKNVPECKIDWLVDSSFEGLLKINPQINEIICIPLRSWLKNKLGFIGGFMLWRRAIKAKFGNKYYDYIIDAQGLLKSAALTPFFKGYVIGFGRNSVKEKLAIIFYKHKVETGRNHLAIQKNRLLGAQVFNYRVDMSTVNFGIRVDAHARESPYIIFFHATSKASKKYPIKDWATLAKYLITTHNFKIILPFGGSIEKEESLAIKNLLPEFSQSLILPERIMSYVELAKLIMNAEFIFGVDTGLIHLANALNKRLIAIYTDTDPTKTGVFETTIAKNIGNIGENSSTEAILNLFERLLKA